MRVHVPVQLRWGDQDAYNHVNNVELLRILEEARVRALWRTEDSGGDGVDQGLALIDAAPGAMTLTLVARHEVEYRAPISYQRAPLDVQLWIGRIGGASIDICYEVRANRSDESAAALGVTTVVLVDADSHSPRRISPDERTAWEPYVEQPVHFTGRR